MLRILATAVAVLVLAQPAPTQRPSGRVARDLPDPQEVVIGKFNAQTRLWRSSLDQADGVLIEARSFRWFAATYLSPARGAYEVIYTDFTDAELRRAKGVLSEKGFARLVTQSQKFDGYDFKCHCYDGLLLEVTASQAGKVATLSSEALDEGSPSEAAKIMRAWDDLAYRLRRPLVR